MSKSQWPRVGWKMEKVDEQVENGSKLMVIRN
jgi:hypothetical protein